MSTPPNLKVTDNTALLLRAIRDLTGQTVLVGIPDTEADRQPEPGETAPPSNATLGYVHEFGVPERNIPARPFLVPGVEAAMPQVTEQMRKGGRAALAGDRQAAERTLNAAGLIAQSAVRQTITDGPFAPLSPVTLAQREARGRTGDKPLLDTGQLRRSITYVLRPKGK